MLLIAELLCGKERDDPVPDRKASTTGRTDHRVTVRTEWPGAVPRAAEELQQVDGRTSVGWQALPMGRSGIVQGGSDTRHERVPQ